MRRATTFDSRSYLPQVLFFSFLSIFILVIQNAKYELRRITLSARKRDIPKGGIVTACFVNTPTTEYHCYDQENSKVKRKLGHNGTLWWLSDNLYCSVMIYKWAERSRPYAPFMLSSCYSIWSGYALRISIMKIGLNFFELYVWTLLYSCSISKMFKNLLYCCRKN